MNKLLSKASVYSATPFDYAALADAALERQARDAADKIRALQRGAAVEVGRELIAIKGKLAHGQFDRWVDAEFSWSKSTALNMMRVATEFGDEYATVAYLPPAVVYQLAAPSTPPAVREAVKQVKPGHQISASSVRTMIKEARTADYRKQRKQGRLEERGREAERVRQTGLTLEQRLERQREQDRKLSEARVAHATDVADRLRAMLGDHLAEFHALMQTVESYDFINAMRKMLACSTSTVSDG